MTKPGYTYTVTLAKTGSVTLTYDDQDGSQTIGIQRDDDAASENTIGVEVTGA